MKIAIIENDEIYQKQLKQAVLTDPSWDYEIFTSPADFGITDIDSYDVIISEYELPNINGRELIKSISSKTSAQIFLMSTPLNFREEDVNNSAIRGLINKDDPEDILKHLRYADIKLKIKKLSEKERKIFNDFIVVNGYEIDQKDDLHIIRVTDILSDNSINKLKNDIEYRKMTKAVISFPDIETATSGHLNTLVKIYKIFLKKKSLIVFWNEAKNQTLIDQLLLCHLNRLFPILEDFQDVKEFFERYSRG